MGNNTINDAIYKKLKNEYLDFMKLTVSGRGFEEGDYERFDHKIKDFKESYQGEISEDMMKRIKHIIILGHGIKADKLFLSDLLKMCNPKMIEDITIFLHRGMTFLDIKDQVDFLRRQFVYKNDLIRFEEYNPNEIDTLLLNKISNSINSY